MRVRRLLLILTLQVDRFIYARAWPVRRVACTGTGPLHCALRVKVVYGMKSDSTDARADGSLAAWWRGARRLASSLCRLAMSLCRR